jgi:hypothetical protein
LILKTLSARKRVGQTLVGFAAETDDIENYALRKLVAKNLDLIVANQVGYSVGAGNAFGADDNRVVLLGRGGFRLAYGPAPKADVAHWLIARILAVSTRPSGVRCSSLTPHTHGRNARVAGAAVACGAANGTTFTLPKNLSFGAHPATNAAELPKLIHTNSTNQPNQII